MEREVWMRIASTAEGMVKEGCGRRYGYHPREIALVYLWASLPPWVRGLRRVEHWICAKLTIWNCAKHVRRSVA